MEPQNHESSVTIDQLAVMVNNGFKGLQKQFNERIDSLDHKLSTRIDGIDQRIDGLDQSLNERIDGLERKMDLRFNGVQNQLDNICLNYTPRTEHAHLKERVRKVEHRIGLIAA